MFTGTAVSCLTTTTIDMYVYTLFHLIINVALVLFTVQINLLLLAAFTTYGQTFKQH